MRLRATIFLLTLLVACTPGPSAPPASKATAEVFPSASIGPELAEAIRFRRATGLRADEVWVRAVATNPASIVGLEAYGIPMLPSEIQELETRLSRVNDALAFGASYAAEYPEGFAGAAVDAARGYRLILLYTVGVDHHRQRLSGLPAVLRPEVRQATWTAQELEDFEGRVDGTTATIPGIKLYDATIDTLANRVVVAFGAKDPALGQQLTVQFESTGWLVPDWVGPFEPEDRPLGILVVTVVNEAGDAVAGLPCWYTSVETSNAAEGEASTSATGLCRFLEVPQGRYRVDIFDDDELVDRLLATTEVQVLGGSTREVTIVLSPPQ